MKASPHSTTQNSSFSLFLYSHPIPRMLGCEESPTHNVFYPERNKSEAAGKPKHPCITAKENTEDRGLPQPQTDRRRHRWHPTDDRALENPSQQRTAWRGGAKWARPLGNSSLREKEGAGHKANARFPNQPITSLIATTTGRRDNHQARSSCICHCIVEETVLGVRCSHPSI